MTTAAVLHRRAVLTLAGVSATAALLASAALVAPAQAREFSSTDASIRAGVVAQLSSVPGAVAVRVIDGETGSFVAGRAMDTPFVSASTMKVVTAATALATFGANHRFTTAVVQGARPRDVVLVGGGDPLLTSADLSELAARTARQLALRDQKVARVKLDDTAYPAPSNATGWLSVDIPTYAAPVRSLGLLSDYSWDTAANAASRFVTALAARGISATYAGRGAAAPGAERLARVRPHTVGQAVDLMLTVSENNVAEQLFRQVALRRSGSASWASAAREAAEVLVELGVPMRGVVLADGSGLSSANRLTARALTSVLRVALDSASPIAGVANDGYLPAAGVNGTLTYRFTGASACARGEVLAKTGSLTGVQTLAGITRGSDGRWKVFAILVNRAYGDARGVIDRMAAEVNGCV